MTDDIDFKEATICKPSNIKRVSKDTVNKLLSAQVILNIGIAVKELIENSVDAGSTIIEIKIKNYGLDGFDVVDNGTGIEEENFNGICGKYHTSKLKEFSDLETIRTFGFRGEALSSLCGLTDLIVTTRHSTSDYGTKLVYDHEGNIIERSKVARNVGTSVTVTNFFKTLPVRKAEFQKNYKKDFSKMIQLLQEYCLVLTGIKIICTNQLKNGSRQTVLSTNGNSILDNIISIFGSKQSQDIVRIKCPTNDGTETGVYTQESLFDMDNMIEIKEKEIDNLNQNRFKIDGYISSIDHSCGRSMKDRQFIYVNSRPCEMREISKLVNEIYHKYNMKQYPFLYLNLKVDQSTVDVNLSKDKRQLRISDDKVLLLVVKRSLMITFGDMPAKFKYGCLNNSVKKFETMSGESEDEDDKIMIVEPSSNFGASLKQWKLNPSNPIPNIDRKKKSELSKASQDKLPKIDSFLYKRTLNGTSDEESEIHNAKKIAIDQKSISQASCSIKSLDSNSTEIEFLSPKLTSTQEDVSYRIDCKTHHPENTLKFEKIRSVEPTAFRNVKNENSELRVEDDVDLTKVPKDFLEQELMKPKSEDQENLSFNKTFELNLMESNNSKSNMEFNISEIVELDVSKSIEKSIISMSLSIDMIKNEAMAEESAAERLKLEMKKSFKLKFKETIDPSKNKKAEAELETEIKKDMFNKMKVLGQFNLGFIIAQLESDLFIVDQHATDERYNFEDLEKNLKIESQSMVIPEKLVLTALQEDTIIDNLNVFEMNGFKFNINKNGLPTQRISLISRPYSKNWEYGREDIEEMIYLLQDSLPDSICRPSRIRSMLASRACRKSVMIGTALDKKEMKQLLSHMGEIDHPWNCPHGRPTIRFLQNLDFINNYEES